MQSERGKLGEAVIRQTKLLHAGESLTYFMSPVRKMYKIDTWPHCACSCTSKRSFVEIFFHAALIMWMMDKRLLTSVAELLDV